MTKFCIDGDVYSYAPINMMLWSICNNLQSEPLDYNIEWKKAQYKTVCLCIVVMKNNVHVNTFLTRESNWQKITKISFTAMNGYSF